MWSNIILTKGKGDVGDEDGSDGKERTHPPSRYKHCGVLVPTTPTNSNYDLYIFGGRSGTFPLKDFWRLDLKLGRWEEIRPLPNDLSGEWPPHLQEHSMVYYQGHIYIFGGEISLSYGEDLSPLWIYSVQHNKWRRWSPPSSADDNTNKSYSGNKEKSSSGVGSGWMMKKSKIKSPEMARQAQTMTKTPVGRRGHSAVCWNNYMLIYGGYRDLKGSLGDLWAFHFETESWHLFASHDLHKQQNIRPWYLFSAGGLLSSSSSFPSPRHSHTSVLHNNTNLYIHGGMQDLQELQDFWKFDLKTRLWTQIKTKYGPGPLHGHVGLVALESLLLMAGERDGKAVDEFWRFDFLNELWERIVLNGCRPCPRVWAWGTILPMVYKRVQGNPNDGLNHPGHYLMQNQVSSPASTEENKYWWDYDETLAAHPEDPEEEEKEGAKLTVQRPSTNGHSSEEQRRRSSLGANLFSEFTRFACNNGDYQALSESNSVCLSEEENSPCPKSGHIRNMKSHLTTECQTQCQKELKMIEEQDGSAIASLIDLGEEQPSAPVNNFSSEEDSPTSPQQDGMGSLTFDQDISIATTNSNSGSTTRQARRSESATCLQLNLTKRSNNSVKKSASVRFADMEPPSTSSSTHLMSLTRECTSDYSSMDNGLNLNGNGRGVGGGAAGFENPNYHGSGSSNLFHHNNPSCKVVEAYEMGTLSPVDAGGIILEQEPPPSYPTSTQSSNKPTKDDHPPPYYHYQVSTPNYMLLIGGNEFHSTGSVVSKRQPLSIWRLRVTRELFASSSASSPSSSNADFSYPSGSGGGGIRPSSGNQNNQRKVTMNTTTGF